jgi:hypothetical protein
MAAQCRVVNSTGWRDLLRMPETKAKELSVKYWIMMETIEEMTAITMDLLKNAIRYSTRRTIFYRNFRKALALDYFRNVIVLFFIACFDFIILFFEYNNPNYNCKIGSILFQGD